MTKSARASSILVVVLVTIIVASAGSVRAAEVTSVTHFSPDRRLQLKLLADQPRLRFEVTAGGVTIVEPSALVFLVDGADLTDGTTLGAGEAYVGDSSYATRGVHAWARDAHKGARHTVMHTASGTRHILEVRTFNDGVAFRFVLEGRPGQRRVPDEKTVFKLPAGAVAWYHGLRGHYEGEYARKQIDDATAAGEWAAPPVTFKLAGAAGYGSITEAGLVGYSGMALERDGSRGLVVGLAHRQPVSYPYELRYSPEDVERLKKPAVVEGTITTPWRVVMVGKDLNTLVNSDIVSNLSTPPDPELFPRGVETEWVKPGRAVWKYLDNPEQSAPGDPLGTGQSVGGAKPQAAVAATTPASRPRGRQTTPEEMKEFSRLAGELGFEYNVLEGFWRRWTDEQLRDVAGYSRERRVGLFVWVHSRNLRTPEERAGLFKRCRDTGIVGLKIDFFDHEHKETIDQYHAILREAAQNKLLLDFHGANKPAGEARTWPNELVREAVRGMEASKLRERAAQNTTLPFTRFLAGPAEYTPVVFGPRRGDTTWAHQVATAAVFTAPLLTYGGHPRNLLDSPAAAMIRSVPATWDETRVLPPSEIGEVAVFARRKGDVWFLAVLNGHEARAVEVPLASILPPGAYRALVLRDVAGNPAAIDVKDQAEFPHDTALSLQLASGGGFIARFTKDSSK